MVRWRPSRALVAMALVLGGCADSHPPEPGPAPAALTGSALTPEERQLGAEGFLGPDYAPLRAAYVEGGLSAAWAILRQGKSGPFSDDFGDPRMMLAAARYAHTHPEFARLLHDLRRGDLILISRSEPGGLISRVTAGPFSHCLLCIDPSPPGQFIEAIGMTILPGDPTGDRVRWTTGARYATQDATVRLIRPADLAGIGRKDAIDKALAFAQAQLGKPYNFAFSDATAGERAYYCSSLALRAYEAGGLHLPLTKEPARDRTLMALREMALALEPDDPLALANATMAFVHRTPAPSHAELAAFVIERLLPHTRRTAPLVRTEAQRRRLAAAVTQVLDGTAWNRSRRADAALQQAERNAAHALPVWGNLQRTMLESQCRVAQVQDLSALVSVSGVDWKLARDPLGAIARAAWPRADVLVALLSGDDSHLAHAAGGVLDLVARLGGPGRPPERIDADFVSPTDLAWCGLPHVDYNRHAGTIDPPGAPGTVHPSPRRAIAPAGHAP